MNQKNKHLLVNSLQNKRGQSFIEFIFLITILTTLSLGFKTGFNHYIGARWHAMLQLVAIPEHQNLNVLNK